MIETLKMVTIKNLFIRSFRRKSQKLAEIPGFLEKKYKLGVFRKIRRYGRPGIICYIQRKTPKCKYWVSKVLCPETQMVCSGWLKNDSLCLRL